MNTRGVIMGGGGLFKYRVEFLGLIPRVFIHTSVCSMKAITKNGREVLKGKGNPTQK